MAKQFIITFFKKIPQNWQNSRPGETYPYVILWVEFTKHLDDRGNFELKLWGVDFTYGLEELTFLNK